MDRRRLAGLRRSWPARAPVVHKLGQLRHHILRAYVLVSERGLDLTHSVTSEVSESGTIHVTFTREDPS